MTGIGAGATSRPLFIGNAGKANSSFRTSINKKPKEFTLGQEIAHGYQQNDR